MSAPVTEAHKQLAASVAAMRSLLPAAQLVANSEARATERANAQVESLISSAKNAIPDSEHPAEPTVENWAWQIRNLGDDSRLVYAERDQLRAEVEREREWQAGVLVNAKLHHAERKEAIARAERAEAELAAERARVVDLVADLNDACITLASAAEDCDDYAMQNTGFKLTAVREVLLQHIPNAAMKEGA